MKSNTFLALLTGIAIGAAAVILYTSNKELKSILDSIDESVKQQNSEDNE